MSNLPKVSLIPSLATSRLLPAKKTRGCWLRHGARTDLLREKDGKRVAFTFTAIGDSNTVKNRVRPLSEDG